MKLVNKTISLSELSEMSQKMFGGLVKGVVDINKKTMVVDAPMHADEEQMLLDQGSVQENLWGINLYPKGQGFDLEFDSMINMRPNQNNFSRSVEDVEIQNKIREVVNTLVSK